MSEVLGGLSTGSSVAVLVGLIGGLGLLVRGFLRYRSRVQAEREWSARTRARTMGLIRLVGGHSADVRIDERDRDGHRVVELRGLRRTDGGEAA
ncbi:hypothetical protein GCM10022225_70860 [Plantactinospora mayteni]|uniref:Preprotein translocase subunit YajC n=1 Tax=Plantactinospora mayteni TaxID=566021 RepID=A0ABQ4EVQ7_9ACTN|nr:hypothetical protein [Plantactinospora mayteni]GIG98759.1 hypothetical protein Pma05_53320 [Plantactinospora mayteni]